MSAPSSTSPDRSPGACAPRHIVLAGNPNCGKTTLFNALTGLRAKVGNYPGVTVERKEGRWLGASKDQPALVLDLPGTYSLSPQSLDEQIARDILLDRLQNVPAPDVVVVVVDASNLQRNLYLATQIIELGYPTLIALNMIDVAYANGVAVDAPALAKALGVCVVPIVASRQEGLDILQREIGARLSPGTKAPAPPTFASLDERFTAEVERIARLVRASAPERRFTPESEALLALSDERFFADGTRRHDESVQGAVVAARERLEKAGLDWRSAVIEARYARIAAIQQAVTSESHEHRETTSDRLDRVFTHRLWGLAIFVGLMALIFQTIFRFAELPMTLLESAIGWVGEQAGSWLAPGPLTDLLVNGVINGVGSVVIFLPQICLLFLFIGLLEDTGYMARAAFLMDRLMSKVGLHGKSFIPMLSSFACAIPGIMATRTIESAKDRLVTILVAPLMSCSARLPVYTLLIAACIPNKVLWDLTYEVDVGVTKFNLFGFARLPGLTMLAMYLLGTIVALLMAWLFKKTLLKGPTPMLIMELPPYKRPVLRAVLRHMWDRSRLFLKRAGTVILGINILLWFLATYPKDEAAARQAATRRAEIERRIETLKSANATPAATPSSPATAQSFNASTNAIAGLEAELAELAELNKLEAGEKLRHSFAGRLGRLIEPAIQPLGFDWKIGIGIVTSFAAREVFVSTMSLVYNVGEADDSDEGTQTLAQTLREQKHADGSLVYTPLVAVTLMVFYVFALQCVSTVAVVRRETNGWKWPVFQFLYMGALAWILAFVTYHAGRLLGLG